MCNPYVVIHAGSLSRHAGDILSLCVYYDLFCWQVSGFSIAYLVKGERKPFLILVLIGMKQMAFVLLGAL